MAFIIKDRVKEGTTTTGTGAISLSGAAATFDSFSSYMSNGDTTYYAIVHTSTGVDEWEVGIGTWNTGNTLTRTTVLAGSNGTSAENFSAGTKDIFMTYPASKAVYTNVNGDIDIDGGTIDGTTIGAVTASSGNFTTGDFTGDVEVDGKIHIGDYVDFDAQASHPSHREGRLWYDNIHKTLNYHSEDSNVVHELGVEEHARVYNNSGSTISKGKPIYFSGSRSASGTHVPTIALANATEESKYKSEGMTASDIPNNSYGYVVIAGLLDGLDTSHLSVGQFFTGITDGATQTMPPVYPNFPMCLGFVVKVDSSEGVVFLAQQNHSIKTFRVQMDQHIGGNLTIDGNLNVTGTTSSTSTSDVTAGAPFYRANEGDAIGEAGTTFTGTGLDDAFFSGHYTGTAPITYDVKIDGVGTGTGGVDTFAVSRDGFVTTFSSANDMTGNKQLIHSGDNIYVEFGATTGHTLNDNWEGTASPVNVDSGFWTNRNTGTTGVGYTHMGIWYDASSSKWYLTDEYNPVPSGAIDRSHSSYAKATLDANIEGNVTGNVTGNLTGNATSATALETARTIGGVSFDGSANINLPGVNASGNQNTSGNAATATALATSRTIQITGDVTGSATFDGSANATINAVVQDDSHSHVISNVDGLQTALDAKTPTARTITAGDGLTGGGNLTANRTLNIGAGGGITVGADTVSHADTSSQASVNNSSGTVIQDITLDTYGHITGIASTNLDGRYYTETEADSLFVNVAGDTMTGVLSIQGVAPIIKLAETGVTNNPVWWQVADSGNYSIRLNNTGAYPFVITTNGTNNAVSNIEMNYNTDFASGIDVTGNITVSGTVDGVDIAARNGTLTNTTNTANAALPKAGGAMTGAITTNSTFDGRDVATDGTKLDTIETNADVTDTTNVVAALTAGTNVSIAANGTISSTDTNTTYSVGDNGLTQRNFTNTFKAKLEGIESGATADQTNAEIRAAVEAASNSNVFTDADHTKLNGIETAATADQTITAGSGLSGGGTGNVTLSHSDTSSQGSSNNSGRTYIQDITLDTYGHVTGLATATETVTNTDTNTTYTAGTDLSLSGTTFNHSDTSALSGTYGSTSNSTKIDQITVDARGHVTAITTGTTGDIEGVTAGTGLSGGGTSGTVTISHPTTAGNKHIPSGGASGQVLGYSSSGTAVWTNPASGGDTIGAVQYSGYYDPGTTNSSYAAYLKEIGDLNTWMLVSVDKASYVVTRPADQGGNLTYWKFRKRYRSFS